MVKSSSFSKCVTSVGRLTESRGEIRSWLVRLRGSELFHLCRLLSFVLGNQSPWKHYFWVNGSELKVAVCKTWNPGDVCIRQRFSTEFKEFSRQWNFVHVTSSPTLPQSNGKVEAAVNSAKTAMRKSRKARTDPYLAFLEYRNAPSRGLGTSPVQRLMRRRRRPQLPIIPQLLTSVVQPGTYQHLLPSKEWQVLAYNRGCKDLGALRNGDTVVLVSPGNSSTEAVNVKVERCVRTRSFEGGYRRWSQISSKSPSPEENKGSLPES